MGQRSDFLHVAVFLFLTFISPVESRSFQAKGMGEATVAYPVDSLEAGFHPSHRAFLGSRLDFSGKSLSWAVNFQLNTWLNLGFATEEKTPSISLKKDSHAIGVSLSSLSWLWDGRGKWSFGARIGKGIILGFSHYLHPRFVWAFEGSSSGLKSGVEWRPSFPLCLRAGFKIDRHEVFPSFGATIYIGFFGEVSFAITRFESGVSFGFKF